MKSSVEFIIDLHFNCRFINSFHLNIQKSKLFYIYFMYTLQFLNLFSDFYNILLSFYIKQTIFNPFPVSVFE